MIKCNLVYALFLMLFYYTSSVGQDKINPSKNNVKSVSHGPTGIVRNLIQDKKGNIWIASWEGVFKYDARLPMEQEKAFTNLTSKVSSARFFSILEDGKGNFWFGSIGSGVYYYDGQSFRNFTTKEGLANNSVTCIYEDKAGNIWFGTGDGASRYDGKSFKTYKMSEGALPNVNDSVHVSAYQNRLPDNHWMHNDINSIIQDKTGKFYFGTRGHTFICDARTLDEEGKSFTTLTDKNGKPFRNVRSIIEDKKGNIWLAGQDGLWRYNGHTFANLNKNFVGYIHQDNKGNIWTSAELPANETQKLSGLNGKSLPNGKAWTLSRYDSKTLSDEKPAVSEIWSGEGMIFGILATHDGKIWFGTTNGVLFYDARLADRQGKM